MYINGLDDIDNSLLTLLKENARYSYSELADRVGLSRIAVRNRIQAMEKARLIRGYEVKIAPGGIDNSLEFIISVSPKPEYYDCAVDVLTNCDMIYRVCVATGDCRIYAFGTALNVTALDELYHRLKSIFSEVSYFNLDIIASTYKDVDGGITYEGNVKECTEDA